MKYTYINIKKKPTEENRERNTISFKLYVLCILLSQKINSLMTRVTSNLIDSNVRRVYFALYFITLRNAMSHTNRPDQAHG